MLTVGFLYQISQLQSGDKQKRYIAGNQ